MTSEDEKSSPVDLGLKVLLSASEQAPVPYQKILASNDKQDGESDPQEVLADAQSEYERLAGEHRWAEIIACAETALTRGDDPEARLWWIRGHLEGFTMPVSFLSAPLESVCHSVAKEAPDSRIVALLRTTGRTVMKRLFEVGDKDHMLSLQHALEKAGVYEEERYRRRTNAKSGVTLQHAMDIPQTVCAESATIRASDAVHTTRDTRRTKMLLSAVLVPSAVIAGYYATTLSQSYFQPVALLADETFVVEPLELELAAPLLDHRDAVGSLSALFYSINGTAVDTRPNENVADSGALNQAPAVIEATTDVASLQQTNALHATQSLFNAEQKRIGATPPPAPTASKRKAKVVTKEKVNTQGPVEGPEFKERARRERLPERRDEPLIMEQRPDEFDGSGVYRVITSTKVLSAPSYSGRVVGVLEPEDRVYVEARLGRWLRLRSRKGKGGFVLAEDVAGRSD